MKNMWTRAAWLLLSCALVAAGCSSSTDPGADGGLVARALSDLPQIPADGSVQIVVGDFAAAAELQNVASARFTDQYRAVIFPRPRTEGGIGFQFAVPEFFRSPALSDETFEEEAGFSPLQIERFAEVSSPPEKALVIVGPPRWGGIAESHDDGLMTFGQGNDFDIGLDSIHVFDQLGRPFRVTEIDGRLAATLSTPLLLEWRDGVAPRYSDDDRVAPLAAELDNHDVISAFLLISDFLAPPELSVEGEQAFISEPFVAAGIGNAVRDGRTVEVVTYHFGAEDVAEAALPSVEVAWTDGSSLLSREPVSQMVELESITQSGPVITVVYVVPDNRVGPALNMLFARDITFAHS